jgi:hypothetical protein
VIVEKLGEDANAIAALFRLASIRIKDTQQKGGLGRLERA